MRTGAATCTSSTPHSPPTSTAAPARRAATSAKLKRLIKEAGLPEPLSNVHVEGIEVDLFWPDRALCVEVDGHGHGRSPTQREDKLKQRLLEALGYTVLRFGEEEIGRSAIARLQQALADQ